jgi:sphinganine C4-monooxygenase
MELFSEEALSIVTPIMVYWAYSGMYVALGKSVDKYRLHSREEEDSKNIVSRREVVMVVLSQQLVQAAFSTILMMLTVVCNITSLGN